MDTNLIPWLVNELEDRGWSQRELSRRAGVSQSTVSDVLAYKRQPTWDFCAAVAKALKVDVDEVFVLAGLKRPPPTPVAEEQEAVGILRSLPESMRSLVMTMLRGVAREEGVEMLASVNKLQVRYVGEEPETYYEVAPAYDPETRRMLQEIAEGLAKLSPEKREELTRKYLALLEFEETLEKAEAAQQPQEVVREE